MRLEDKLYNRFVASLLLVAGLTLAIPASAHPKLNVPVTSQDSPTLRFHRASASLHEDQLRVRGSVKRVRGAHLPHGQLRVEAWEDDHCVLVQHVRWSRITRVFKGRFWTTISDAAKITQIHLAHVGKGDPDSCPDTVEEVSRKPI